MKTLEIIFSITYFLWKLLGLCYCKIMKIYIVHIIFYDFQQMRRSGNKEENKRIIMDLEVVLKCTDYPYIVQCIGCFITAVSTMYKVLLNFNSVLLRKFLHHPGKQEIMKYLLEVIASHP